MKTAIVYVLASLGEIAGCFSFWAWLRQGKSPLWLVPGMISLAVFAYLLTRIDSHGRTRVRRVRKRIYRVVDLLALGGGGGATRSLGHTGCSSGAPGSRYYRLWRPQLAVC